MTEAPTRPFSNDEAPALARRFARAMADAGGEQLAAVILYGSQLHGSSPSEHSAWDLVVVVDRYPPFHRALRAAGHQSRSARVMDFMGSVLPPYVTAFDPLNDGSPMAKCLVLRRDQFAEAMGPRSKDHFLKGRLIQKVSVVWAADPATAREMEGVLEAARREVLSWAGPFLEEPFDARSLTRRMLAVSFAGEVRPESGGRVMEVWAAQRGWMEETFGAILEEALRAGVVRKEGQGYAFTRPRTRSERLRYRAYFTRNKFRGVMRWAKHTVTFNDWLSYIQRKAERRTGLTIELTPAERRWPLIFLWPKVFRVLREGRTSTDHQEPQE